MTISIVNCHDSMDLGGHGHERQISDLYTRTHDHHLCDHRGDVYGISGTARGNL